MSKLPDQLALLAVGISTAFAAWAFWHFAQSDAMTVLLLLALLAAVADNVRLRIQTRKPPRIENANDAAADRRGQ